MLHDEKTARVTRYIPHHKILDEKPLTISIKPGIVNEVPNINRLGHQERQEHPPKLPTLTFLQRKLSKPHLLNNQINIRRIISFQKLIFLK